MSTARQAPASKRQRRGRPVSKEKQSALLEAAIAEFQKHGYEGASIDAIAAEAGISKRTLYNHFPSKEALFRSLVEEMGHRVRLFSELEYRRDIPVRDQLSRYAHASARLIQDKETLALFRAILAEHVRTPALVASVMKRQWDDEYGFAAWVVAACRDGKLRAKSPERAAHHFASLIKGAAVWPVVFRPGPIKSGEIEAAIEEAIEMFLRYYTIEP
jgi:TetR/AcrR family transcriptional regulator of autoinduction and epiphytic fitness